MSQPQPQLPPRRSQILEVNMPPVVRTRRATTVRLPSGCAPGRRCVPLSPFDTRWIALPPVCHVFLFPAARPQSPPRVPFSDVVRALSSSLALVLQAFHPLAGQLAYSPELGTVSIVCSEDAGVTFVEAETDLEFSRLVKEGVDLDVDALRQLVPDIRREELPAPVLAAQVTEFVGGSGGIAVGVSLNHCAADGVGFFRFMERWAAEAVAASPSSEQVWVTRAMAPPLHDRKFVRFVGDQELASGFLRLVAPDLPRVVPKQDATPGPELPLTRRTFTFAAHAVRLLKHRLAASGVVGAAPSTFAALAAHGWVCIARASGFTDGAPVFAVFLADCRARMRPRVPDAYAGNCVASCVVALSGAELTGPDGALRAFSAIRDAVAEVKRDPLAGSSGWIARFRAVPPGRMVLLAGSPSFPAYAVDFGFGSPARVERASVLPDGGMAIFAGREAGSVQACVAIAAEKMPAFQEIFQVADSFTFESSRL
ncbi:hypothetical protein BS78_01G245300 [Paspalum vaginatum]|nr:hypothetical protein BS78_01G245300 [Paspalum vaginatum]